MSINIKSGLSTDLLEVDVDKHLKINQDDNINNPFGYVIAVSESDAGLITNVKTVRPIDIDYDYRMSYGNDTILWYDTFMHNTLNTSKYSFTSSTMNFVMSGGSLIINANNSTTNGNGAKVNTYRTFPIYAHYPIIVDFVSKFSAAFQANSIIEFGLGYMSAATADLQDGIAFRASGSTNAIQCVMVNNLTATTGSTFITGTTSFVPTVNTFNRYSIIVNDDMIEFWIDNILRTVLSTSSGFTSSLFAGRQSLFMRMYNIGTVPAAIEMSVAQIGVSIGDMDTGRDWRTNMVSNGQSSISLPDGQPTSGNTSGQTANMKNSTLPTYLIPTIDFSNTTAGYTTLGGQFSFSAVTGSETDYALFGYQNPAGTAAIPGKNLYITGIAIQSYASGGTVTTTPTLFQWSLGAGSTSESLATTDSATAGTRAPRIMCIGTQGFPIGKTSGESANRDINVVFNTQILVEQGTYCHLILKMPISTQSDGLFYRGICMINGYFE